MNERNANTTFTTRANISATDDQGVVRVEVGHEVTHLSFDALDPLHPVVSFDKMYFTCT
jgi:hypothetical protein